MISRRRFVLRGATLATAAGLLPSTLVTAAAFARQIGFDPLSYAALAACVGTAFVVQAEAGPMVALELIDARKMSPAPRVAPNAPDAAHEKFSLRFRGPRHAALSQQTYSLEHRRLGRVEIFIVPMGSDADGNRFYEAVFNRPAGGLGTA